MAPAPASGKLRLSSRHGLRVAPPLRLDLRYQSRAFSKPTSPGRLALAGGEAAAELKADHYGRFGIGASRSRVRKAPVPAASTNPRSSIDAGADPRTPGGPKERARRNSTGTRMFPARSGRESIQ
jgi:hypothetical protein